MTEVREAAPECDSRHRCVLVGTRELSARVLQPHRFRKRHRRVAAAPAEGGKNRARSDTRHRRQILDADRLIPVGLDIGFNLTNGPRGGILCPALEQMTERVAVRTQERDHNDLFEFMLHKRRQFHRGGVQLLRQKGHGAQQVLCIGRTSRRRVLEPKRSGRLRTQNGAQFLDHALFADAQDELNFMTDSIDLGSLSMRSFVFHPA